VSSAQSPGPTEPKFHPPTNLEAVQEDFYNKGVAFIEGCNEESLTKLAHQFGDIVRPRNEVNGAGISNIRFAPSLAGKGYSSDGMTRAQTFSTLTMA
jgi:hypothetical protein